jgi:hypothetical protein
MIGLSCKSSEKPKQDTQMDNNLILLSQAMQVLGEQEAESKIH